MMVVQLIRKHTQNRDSSRSDCTSSPFLKLNREVHTALSAAVTLGYDVHIIITPTVSTGGSTHVTATFTAREKTARALHVQAVTNVVSREQKQTSLVVQLVQLAG